MIVRIFPVLTLILGLGIVNQLYAQQTHQAIKAGDHIAVRITGKLAKEYAKQTMLGNWDADVPIAIETTATVIEPNHRPKIRIEITSPFRKTPNPKHLIKLTANIDAQRITHDMMRGSRLGADGPALDLSELDATKIETWVLTNEIGTDVKTNPIPKPGQNRFTKNPLLGNFSLSQ